MPLFLCTVGCGGGQLGSRAHSSAWCEGRSIDLPADRCAVAWPGQTRAREEKADEAAGWKLPAVGTGKQGSARGHEARIWGAHSPFSGVATDAECEAAAEPWLALESKYVNAEAQCEARRQ